MPQTSGPAVSVFCRTRNDAILELSASMGRDGKTGRPSGLKSRPRPARVDGVHTPTKTVKFVTLSIPTVSGKTAFASRPQWQSWPGEKLASMVLGALLLGYTAFAVVSSLAAPSWAFDDAIPLVHGVLVQQGRIPSIDFFSFYPPLGPYVNAALFTLLGRTIVATRLFGGGVFCLVILLATRLFRSHFPHSVPIAMITVLLVAASIAKGIALPLWPGFGLSAVALLAYLSSQTSPNGRPHRWLAVALSGILTGLAVLYRLNFGAYVAAVVAVDLVINWWSSGKLRWKSDRLKSLSVTAAAFFIPMLICFFGFCFWVYGTRMVAAIAQFTVTAQRTMLHRGFVDLTYHMRLVSCAVVFPAGWYCLRILKARGKLPWSTLAVVAFDVGLLVLTVAWGNHVSIVAILVVAEFASVVFLQLFVQRLPRLEFCLILFYCFQLHYFLSRADGFHTRFLGVVPVMLLPFLLLEDVDTGKRNSAFFSKGVVLAVLGPAILVLFAAPQFRLSASRFTHGIRLIADVIRHPHLADTDRVLGPTRPEAAWASVYPDVDELDALRYLRAATSNADPIFVGVQDHSKVFFNDLRIYWLSGRPIGVKTFQLETGDATEPGVQRGIIADLNQNNVQWMIIDRHPEPGDETFIRRAYVGSTLLDSYIRTNYQEQARFGQFSVLRGVRMPLP